MASISVNRLTNANVYVDGNSFLGQVAECNLPDIVKVMSEHVGLGMIGKIELPSGIDKLEASFKFNSIYPEAMKAAAGYGTTSKLQLRGNIETYESAGKTGEIPYKVFMTGQWKNLPAGNFKAMDNVEMEKRFSVTAIRIEIDGTEILQYDAMANIYIVDGNDQLATYRSNLGV